MDLAVFNVGELKLTANQFAKDNTLSVKMTLSDMSVEDSKRSLDSIYDTNKLVEDSNLCSYILHSSCDNNIGT